MSTIKTIYGYCDSLCEQKGHSPMHIGFWGKDGDDNILFAKHEIVRDRSGQKIRSTNNQAEYYALIRLWESCYEWAFKNLTPDSANPLPSISGNDPKSSYTLFMERYKSYRRSKSQDQGTEESMLQEKRILQPNIDRLTTISNRVSKVLKTYKSKKGKQINPDLLCDMENALTKIAFNVDVTGVNVTEFQMLNLLSLPIEDLKILSYIREKSYQNKAELKDFAAVQAEIKEHKDHIVSENNLILHFHTDANLMFSQLCALPGIGNKVKPWKVRDPGLKSLFNRVESNKYKLNFTLEWIPREENERANQLAENQVARDNFKKLSVESWSRRAEVVETKRSVNDLPDSDFVADFFKSDLPTLKDTLIELAKDQLINWEESHAVISAMEYQISVLTNRIPNTPDLQQSRKMHAEAGRLSKDTLQLLPKNYRGIFNGPFISYVMNMWRSGKEVSPDELANLALHSIEQNKEHPSEWFHNLVRVHSPLNTEIIQNSTSLLESALVDFSDYIRERDDEGFKQAVLEFFGRLGLSSNVSEVESIAHDFEEVDMEADLDTYSLAIAEQYEEY